MWSLVFLSQPPGPDVSQRLPGDRYVVVLHAVHAQSDDRILLLCAAQRRHRNRHLGRGGDDAADVGGHGATQFARRRRTLSGIVETARAGHAPADRTDLAVVGSSAAATRLPATCHGGSQMNFGRSHFIRISELRHIRRPRLPVGILVLGAVHDDRRASSPEFIDHAAFDSDSGLAAEHDLQPDVRSCQGLAVGDPPIARHRPHRLVDG